MRSTRISHKNSPRLGSFRINPVVKLLISSDFLIVSAFGLLAPVFAIFLTDSIQGGSVEVAGFAAAIWALSRGVFQIPMGIISDRGVGRHWDFKLLLGGSLGIALIPLAYLFAETPLHIYLIQGMYGFFQAMAWPTWTAVFTRYIDPHEEGFEWATYQTVVDFGVAAAAGIGGVVAFKFGFEPLFMAVSAFSIFGFLILVNLYLRVRRAA